MFRIEQHGTTWRVSDADGNQVGEDHASYDDALAAIAAAIGEQLAVGDGADSPMVAPALPERWTTTTGVAFSEPTGDGRDFTRVTWTWRDPGVYVLPLMDQTETEVGHFGAELAGWIDMVEDRGGTLFMGGGFYNNERGVAMRDRMLATVRQGVSLDPGRTVVEFECTEYDDDGWCNDGTLWFMEYEAIGLTGTPFPGFANATIELETAATAAEPAPADGEPAPAEPVAASFAGLLERPTSVVASGAPIAPPSAWFHEPEPQVGDERLVEQPDGSLACPLTITDDGQVYGHVARWGQCHVGYPQGLDVCVEPPESSDEYPEFHLGHVICDDGADVPTGVLVAGCDHPSVRLSAPEARDHYAHNGAAWADVRATNGDLGVWVSGALRPDVSELQVRVLRASSLSGDWRPVQTLGGWRNEMVTALAVNVPGFPISRRALVASGMAAPSQPRLAANLVDGEVRGLVASGIVRPCTECARRNAVLASATLEHTSDPGTEQILDLLAGIQEQLGVLDRRTRHMRGDAAEAIRARLGRLR